MWRGRGLLPGPQAGNAPQVWPPWGIVEALRLGEKPLCGTGVQQSTQRCPARKRGPRTCRRACSPPPQCGMTSITETQTAHAPAPSRAKGASPRGGVCSAPSPRPTGLREAWRLARQEPLGAGGAGLAARAQVSAQGDLGEDHLAECRVFFFGFPETSGSVTMRT